MKYIKNPMDNSHDIDNTLWHTELHGLSSPSSFKSEEFLYKLFPKGRKKERKNRARNFRVDFTRISIQIIDFNIVDPLKDQLRGDIYRRL